MRSLQGARLHEEGAGQINVWPGGSSNVTEEPAYSGPRAEQSFTSVLTSTLLTPCTSFQCCSQQIQHCFLLQCPAAASTEKAYRHAHITREMLQGIPSVITEGELGADRQQTCPSLRNIRGSVVETAFHGKQMDSFPGSAIC